MVEARTGNGGCPDEGHLNSGSCSEEVSSELNPKQDEGPTEIWTGGYSGQGGRMAEVWEE